MNAYKAYKFQKIKFRIIKKHDYEILKYHIEAYHNYNFLLIKKEWHGTGIDEFRLCYKIPKLNFKSLLFANLEDAKYVFANIITSDCLDRRSINLILGMTDEEIQNMQDEVIMESK